ncbi:MAG: response regulator, partial [Planctomycetota bacterium]
IIITAHGSVESATDAMKLGAVDYIQKPFSPDEIRQLVNKVLGREDLEEQEDGDYETQLELIKKNIQKKHFQAAAEQARTAVAMDASRPEAHNLLGALMEILGDEDEAQGNYRKAVSLDPTYEPARNNLNRISGWEPGDTIHLDDGEEAEDIN